MTSSSSTTSDQYHGLYPYKPSHVLPILFAALIGMSFVMHIYQNFRFRYWRVTFFMFWGGAVYLTGWIARAVSSYHPDNLNLYIVQTVFIYAGPPIYSAMAYNLVGRLMSYLPMFALLHPGRVTILYVYIGAVVESVTAAGAAKLATSHGNLSMYKSGGTLISVGLVLQAVVESTLIVVVARIHRQCIRAHMLSPNVRMVCITLYGTSTCVLLRCIFRAVQSFGTYNSNSCLEFGHCISALEQEWYLYALEAVPMVLFTYWINILHPGKYLPRQKGRYLDFDGKTERVGPGWTDRRPKWQTFADPYDLGGLVSGNRAHDMYWLRPESWTICEDSFATGAGSNVKKSIKK